MNRITYANDLNAIRKINNVELRGHLTKFLAVVNVNVTALLTDGMNSNAEDEIEPAFGCAGFELHFTGAESSLTAPALDSLHPATLIQIGQLMDAMTKSGFECALTITDHGTFALVVIG